MSRKDALLAELALSRTALKQAGTALREELDYPTKIRSSVRSSPFFWLGGAAVAGYILAGPKTRVKTVYKKGASGKQDAPGKPKEQEKEAKVVKDLGFLGMAATAFRFAYPMVKPALHAYLARRATEWLSKVAR